MTVSALEQNMACNDGHSEQYRELRDMLNNDRYTARIFTPAFAAYQLHALTSPVVASADSTLALGLLTPACPTS
jgi:hypothetical protein